MNIILFAHGGSFNHGCEALVRSTTKILRAKCPNAKITLFSYGKAEDVKYGVDNVVDELVSLKMSITSTIHAYALALAYKLGFHNCYDWYYHRQLFRRVKKGDICISIGGDTYTYTGCPQMLAYVNSKLKKSGAKTVLWGCSVSEELIKDSIFIEDAKSFDLITVREPISQKLLQDADVKDNVISVSDPAFELDIKPYNILQHFSNVRPVVGINLSPLIMSCENAEKITLRNYQSLVKYIIENTEYNVALIPHVVVPTNDDCKAMSLITDVFKTDRIANIPDMDCERIKGAIGGCKFFIGARTHSTIAAYSQCIPTLVVGYSVKAKGIAESLFGTYENYVLPVQSLQKKDELTHAFKWLEQHEEDIRQHLEVKMPDYKKHCYDWEKEMNEFI